MVCIAFATLGGATASTREASSGNAAPTPVLLSNEVVVTGEIVSRTDQGFVVLSNASVLVTVLVNADTSILKGAESIRLSDLMVGDKVSAKVMRTLDGGLQAVTVNVSTGYE